MFKKRVASIATRRAVTDGNVACESAALEEKDEIEGGNILGIAEKRAKAAAGSSLLKKSAQVSKAIESRALTENDNVSGSIYSGLYSSSGAMESRESQQRVTAVLEIDTDETHDHRAVLERNELIGKQLLAGELEEGIYRGLGAYRPVINRREGAIAAGKTSGNYGPVRANKHVRMTMRIDLNPEICKDYKETGYCGFGDTCIFLHDRTDYKSGWELEREWERQQKTKQERLQRRMLRAARRDAGEDDVSDDSADSAESAVDDDDDDEEKIPFACLICHQKWTPESRPIITQCKHYFCESCALKHYAKSSKCAVCNEATNGIFNTAERVLAKLKEPDDANPEEQE